MHVWYVCVLLLLLSLLLLTGPATLGCCLPNYNAGFVPEVHTVRQCVDWLPDHLSFSLIMCNTFNIGLNMPCTHDALRFHMAMRHDAAIYVLKVHHRLQMPLRHHQTHTTRTHTCMLLCASHDAERKAILHNQNHRRNTHTW
jgi:hypothetical protein